MSVSPDFASGDGTQGNPIVNRFVNPSSNLPEKEQLRSWVQLAQAGNQRGQYIYEAYAGRMLLAIVGICREQEALDVLQDGFLKVFRNIGGYTFRGSFEGWMRRIMVNLAIDALRAGKHLQWVGRTRRCSMCCPIRFIRTRSPALNGRG